MLHPYKTRSEVRICGALAALCRDQPVFDRPRRDLRARAYAQLATHVIDVSLGQQAAL